MKKVSLLGVFILLLGSLVFFGGCAEEEPTADPEPDEVVKEAEWPVWDLSDGDYRGHFDDREHSASVQVTIEGEEVVDVSLRWQQYDGVVYDTEDPEIPEDYVMSEEAIVGIAEQYETALEYLIGAQGKEEIVERLGDMEGNPEGTPLLDEITPEEADGFSAATIRSSKLGSAVRDAFNRGRYRE